MYWVLKVVGERASGNIMKWVFLAWLIARSKAFAKLLLFHNFPNEICNLFYNFQKFCEPTRESKTLIEFLIPCVQLTSFSNLSSSANWIADSVQERWKKVMIKHKKIKK